MANLPSGTVTFLFTDIEGSTHLWENHAEIMKSALAEHDAILRQAIESNHGHIIKTTGDGAHAVFSTAIDAVNAALSAQHNLDSLISNLQIKVRMGLHTGEAELRAGDYYGQALNRAARIMSLAHGRQTLLSGITAEIVRDHLPPDLFLLDLGEHRLKDLIRPERIFQLNAQGLPKDFPPLNTIDTIPNNLPVQLTSFIGREQELADAKQKLFPSPSQRGQGEGARLLTLIGPGGTGKTRLSLKLAADLLSSFKDGAWLVELAPLADPSLVLQSIASAFGVREQPGMPLYELVMDYLRDKHLLLVLDNCEHLIETCAQLADQFLHNSPNLRIVASSREALGINGETVYRVPSLSLPDQSKVTCDALAGYESIQLFVERAFATNPKFDLTDKNASSVAQICHRLDGIPLAIELAAARVTVFSAEQIASRLDDRFRLLTGGSRTALPRQQTLRALIDWSYDILSDDERAMLRRLSVFAGGWTFEAAEAICSHLNVLDLLTQLINKSLVVVEEGRDTRYRLLETIRQYARDKLLESGEGEELRNKHLGYFLELAETAEPELQSFEALPWAAKLNAEHDNIRAALEWGLAKDLEASLRMAGALPYFWGTQGYSAEGRRWAMDVLEKSHPGQDHAMGDRQSIIRANALVALSILATDLGDNEAVCSAAAESVVLARRSGDQRILSLGLANLASGKVNLGAADEAYTLAQEALAIARAQGDNAALAFSLVTMGMVTAIAKQDFKSALAYSEEALVLSEKGGYRWGSAMTIFGLGFMARSLGDYDQARSRFRACLPIFLELGDKHRLNMIQSELAHIEREEGHYRQTIPMYQETILEWQRLGHRAAIAHQLECFAFIAKAQEQAERAACLFGAAEALREKINIAMTPQERIEYDHEIADLRAGMDEHLFDSAWAKGRAMTMDQAIENALRE
ncbi:MAG: adenylate/guanylate cyclase domain-containing protein [Anaerolineales bacterium]